MSILEWCSAPMNKCLPNYIGPSNLLQLGDPDSALRPSAEFPKMFVKSSWLDR